MKERKDIIDEALMECLELLYKYSIPSMSFSEFNNSVKEGNEYDKEYFMHHYIPRDLEEEIIDRVKYVYGLGDYFKEYTGVLRDYLINGGTKDTYETDEQGLSHRTYEKTPKLSDVIGEDNAKKVDELISYCRDYYRFDEAFTNSFDFNVYNYSPCNVKKRVEEYYSDKGEHIELDDDEIKKNYYKEEYGDEEI